MHGTGDASLDSRAVARFADRVLSDAAAGLSAALACVGDTLGLYRTMTQAGPVTPPQLAALCDVAPEYADQWLRNQAAGGYVRFDPLSRHFSLPPEHAAVLTDERSQHYLVRRGAWMTNPWSSDPQIPTARTLRRTSPGFGEGSGTSRISIASQAG